MLHGKERSEVFRQVFSNLNTESSSDLIVALHDIGKFIDPDMMVKINPVYNLEYMNWELSSGVNVQHIRQLFTYLSKFNQNEVKLSYNYVYRLFLDDPDLNEIFPLSLNEETPDDDVVFKIFTELSYKRDFCNFN